MLRKVVLESRGFESLTKWSDLYRNKDVALKESGAQKMMRLESKRLS